MYPHLSQGRRTDIAVTDLPFGEHFCLIPLMQREYYFAINLRHLPDCYPLRKDIDVIKIWWCSGSEDGSRHRYKLRVPQWIRRWVAKRLQAYNAKVDLIILRSNRVSTSYGHLIGFW